MALHVAAATHRGKVRAENQDCLLVDSWLGSTSGTLFSTSLEVTDRPLGFAVFDGMGGHAGGALASLLAARGLAEALSVLPIGHTTEQIADAVAHCGRAVGELAQTLPGHASMGTTVVGAVVSSAGVDLFNVGDSRAYRLRGGYLGTMSQDDRVPDPNGGRSSLLSQSLGRGDRVLDVHPLHLDLSPDHTLLLCSDGVHDYVPTEAIAEALTAEEPRACVQSLIRLALEAGAPDNVSAVVLRIDPEPEPEPDPGPDAGAGAGLAQPQ